MELSEARSSVRMTRSEIMDCVLLPFDFVTGNPTESIEVSERRLGAIGWLAHLKSKNNDIEWLTNGDCEIGLVSAEDILSQLIEGESMWDDEDRFSLELPKSKQAMAEELHSDLVAQAKQILEGLKN